MSIPVIFHVIFSRLLNVLVDVSEVALVTFEGAIMHCSFKCKLCNCANLHPSLKNRSQNTLPNQRQRLNKVLVRVLLCNEHFIHIRFCQMEVYSEGPKFKLRLADSGL